ncbi:replication protein C, IncQ-type [Paraburkholderia sediminicola]|uniref:replication protein C, IncQ-type n=1 Tax=Paraburkholderia sediminicola TaxID=458836 RepID=UPI0038BAD5CA
MPIERIVRYDPSLAAAPLFQPVWRGDRPKLNLTFQFNGVTWRWRGPEQLGIAEQTLLLVLLELAAEQSMCAAVGDEQTRQIESALYELGEVRRPPTARLTVSFYDLCRRVGRGVGGSAMSQRRAELQRLCEVTVWARQEDGMEFQSRLLTWQVGNHKGVTVLLNWRLTEVLFGGQFSTVSLNERLDLRSECARALHCALSLRIRPGKSMAFHLDNLAKYIWSDVQIRPVRGRHRGCIESESPAAIALRRRRKELAAAVAEIAALPAWTVKTTAQGAIQFSRRSLNNARDIAPVQGSSKHGTAMASGATVVNKPDAVVRETGIWQLFARDEATLG